MSKTKEQILHSKTIQMTPFYKDIKDAMDEYAQQAVQEYKEKLKVKIERTELLNRAAKHHVYNLIDFV